MFSLLYNLIQTLMDPSFPSFFHQLLISLKNPMFVSLTLPLSHTHAHNWHFISSPVSFEDQLHQTHYLTLHSCVHRNTLSSWRREDLRSDSHSGPQFHRFRCPGVGQFCWPAISSAWLSVFANISPSFTSSITDVYASCMYPFHLMLALHQRPAPLYVILPHIGITQFA